MEKIKDYFKRYPTSDEVFENGGVLFHTRGAADSYAKGKTTPYLRKDVENTITDVDKSDETEQTGAEKELETLIASEMESLKTAEIEKMDYYEIKRLISLFKLVADDNKKDTLIGVLNEFRNQLNKE